MAFGPTCTARLTATAHRRSPQMPTTSRACRQGRSTARIPTRRETSARCGKEGPRSAGEPQRHARLPLAARMRREHTDACRGTVGILIRASFESNAAAGSRLSGAWGAFRGDRQPAPGRRAATGCLPTAGRTSRIDRCQRPLAGCGQTACRTPSTRCRERGSREKWKSVRGERRGQRPRMDFVHGLSAPRRRECSAYGVPHRMTAHRSNPFLASIAVNAIPMASPANDESPPRSAASRHRCRSAVRQAPGLVEVSAVDGDASVTTTRHRPATGHPACAGASLR